MKKRQIKKNEKLHVKLYISDEFKLLTMTPDEIEAVNKDFQNQRNKMANTKYRILKRKKLLPYFIPYGNKFVNHINSCRKLSSRQRSTIHTQSMQTSYYRIKPLKVFPG